MRSNMPKDRSCISGSFDTNGDVCSADVDIIDMSSDNWRSKKWESKGVEVFKGVVDGFKLLAEQVKQIKGFRVRYYNLDYVFKDENSWKDISEELNNQGFNKPKQYHVVYDGSILPRKIGSFHLAPTDDGTMWHQSDSIGISGVSLSTTRASLATSYVRGFHQLMHNYINSSVATEYATTDNGYDAIHQLGTGTKNGRTLMADTHPHRAIRGECSQPIIRCVKSPNNIHFSDCTINAVKRSIQRNQ